MKKTPFLIKCLKALRSGKYTQSTLRLKTDKGFCVNGVFCDTWDSTLWKDSGYGDYIYEIPSTREQSTSYPPDTIRQLLDMSKSEMEKLTNLNDSQGMNFLELANYIEEEMLET